jgi:hypothetical protein
VKARPAARRRAMAKAAAKRSRRISMVLSPRGMGSVVDDRQIE